MSKFLIQMFLSVMVAISAAVGFSPNLKGEVHKAWREANKFSQQTVHSVFDTATVESEAEVELELGRKKSSDKLPGIDAETETSLSIKSETEVEADLELNRKKASHKLPRIDAELETSLSVESEAEAEVEANEVNVDLENEIESGLDLEVGILK